MISSIGALRGWCVSLACAALLTAAGCDTGTDAGQGAATGPQAEQISWDELMPADWNPEAFLSKLEAEGIDDLGDEDPRAAALMEELKAAWAKAPIVPALDGRRVRLAGFVVPLDWEAQEMPGFLLVPYFGACIHVPPPPANQTIHVVMPAGSPYRGGLFDTLWVTGTIRAITTDSDLAAAGYRLDAEGVEPYEGEIEAP